MPNYGTLSVDTLVNSVGEVSSGIYGFKNRIINGAMVLDQRNSGASVTLPDGASGYSFPTDRWGCSRANGATATGQQSSVAPTGFINSLLITNGTGISVGSTGQGYVFQQIEGLNVIDLGWGTANAQTITISFWVRSSITGTHSGSVFNSAFNRSYPFTFTIDSADTWEFETITIPGDTSGTWLRTNGRGIGISFNNGSGSSYLGTAGAWATGGYYGASGSVALNSVTSSTFYVTGVQLEKSSTRTSYDWRPYGIEFELCRRYCQVFPIFPTSSFDSFMSYYGGSNILSSVKRLTTPMRAIPSVTFKNATVEYYSFAGSWTSTTLNYGGYTNESYYIYCGSDGDGRSKLMRNGNSGLDPDPIAIFSTEL